MFSPVFGTLPLESIAVILKLKTEEVQLSSNFLIFFSLRIKENSMQLKVN